jgi:hypothetical protein
MGSLGTTQLTALLVAAVAAGVLCGFVASTIARRKKQRARRFFVAGLFCGFTAGVFVRRGWRQVGPVAVRALGSAALRSPLSGRLGDSPRQLRRLPLALLTVRR